MTFSIYEASAPVFLNSLRDMRAWLDKMAAETDEAALIAARLAPDMLPFAAQYQMACDTAKKSVARLCGIEAPEMADTEASFAELRERCDKTIAYIESVDPAAYAGAETREVVLRFPGDIGFRWIGRDYLTRFAFPNFFFHVTTAYAIARVAGVPLGKPDFLQHLGPPEAMPQA